MREITGNLWDYLGDDAAKICITTNGTVKKNGECVMGRGCALEAKQRRPGLALRLGQLIRERGNRVCWLDSKILAFPVKHNWWERADLELIRQSAQALAAEANNLRQYRFVLPRPGCGNGHLTWADVKPVLLDMPENVWVISR